MSSLPERIQQAKREALSLQEKIKQNRQATDDAKLETFANSKDYSQDAKLKLRRVLKGHSAKVYSVAWSYDSRQIVSAGQDGKLIVWNAYTTYKAHAIRLRSNWVMTCAYSPTGSFVACGGLDNTCSIYNLRNNSYLESMNSSNSNTSSAVRVSRELTGHSGYISCCKFLTDRHILTSSGDMSCILWDVEVGKVVNTFLDHTSDVMTLAVSPDQNNFITGSCDSFAKIWAIRTSKCVQTFVGHESDVNSICYFPNGLSFATGSDDSSCRFFDIRADREMMVYKNEKINEGVTAVAFSHRGRFLFTAYDDKKLICWDTMKGVVVQDIPLHENRISSLQVAPDGSALCTGSWDSTIRLIC